jgi:ATP-dependent Clp protease protease subunit
MGKKRKPIKTEDEIAEELEEAGELEDPSASTIIFNGMPETTTRFLSLYGDVTERRCAEIVNNLFALRELYKAYDVPEEEVEEEPAEEEPIEMLVSTHGGNTVDMFAVYDTMNLVKQDVDISTIGLGKVMSAGVLLLAAGTKGKRKVGAHCRLMLHGVSAGHVGEIHNLKNELEEAQWMQDRYIECLSENTSMTKKQITRLFDKQINTYFDAEDAIDYGIADEII